MEPYANKDSANLTHRHSCTELVCVRILSVVFQSHFSTWEDSHLVEGEDSQRHSSQDNSEQQLQSQTRPNALEVRVRLNKSHETDPRHPRHLKIESPVTVLQIYQTCSKQQQYPKVLRQYLTSKFFEQYSCWSKSSQCFAGALGQN